MDSHYTGFTIIANMERAYDLCMVGRTKEPERRNNKRRRGEWEQETNDELFIDIFTIMYNEDVFPTMRTLLLPSFYQLVSERENNEYFEQVMKIIVDFRYAIRVAEELYKSGRQEDFYFFMIDDLVQILQRSKHPILLFHLST